MATIEILQKLKIKLVFGHPRNTKLVSTLTFSRSQNECYKYYAFMNEKFKMAAIFSKFVGCFACLGHPSATKQLYFLPDHYNIWVNF